jgi:uncharacterized membrane protein
MSATTHRREIDREAVHRAVMAAEQCTSAEIVVAVAPFFIGRMWQAARRAFIQLGVASTRRRNGVLVFVVPSRRQVVVLPDESACDALDPKVWQVVATHIAAAFANGRGTEGLLEGVAKLGDALSAPFPPSPDDVNELPDMPQELGPSWS